MHPRSSDEHHVAAGVRGHRRRPLPTNWLSKPFQKAFGGILLHPHPSLPLDSLGRAAGCMAVDRGTTWLRLADDQRIACPPPLVFWLSYRQACAIVQTSLGHRESVAQGSHMHQHPPCCASWGDTPGALRTMLWISFPNAPFGRASTMAADPLHPGMKSQCGRRSCQQAAPAAVPFWSRVVARSGLWHLHRSCTSTAIPSIKPACQAEELGAPRAHAP